MATKPPRPQNNNLKPNRKGQPRRGGRAKGTKNKFTVSMKEAVLSVFNIIGSEMGMATWARKAANRKAFYNIAAKLIPQELVGKDGTPLNPGAAEVRIYMPDNNRPPESDKDKGAK